MLDNIAKGNLACFFKDNTLVNQDYIKDNKLSVVNYVKSLDKDLIVTGFKRAVVSAGAANRNLLRRLATPPPTPSKGMLTTYLEPFTLLTFDTSISNLCTC
jgi:hypothetical protein